MYDSGIVKVYTLGNIALPGNLPKEGLTLAASFWYEERTVGVTRYTAFLKTDAKIDMLIRIQRDIDIDTSMVCKIDDTQYRIKQAQPKLDDNGLRVYDISLERSGDTYDIVEP